MNIKVDHDIDTIFREYLYIGKNKHKYCKCDWDAMLPLYPANFRNVPEDCKICANCGLLVTSLLASEYNRVHNYSGWDDSDE